MVKHRNASQTENQMRSDVMPRDYAGKDAAGSAATAAIKFREGMYTY